ncbi:MAG: nicotinate-nucleotide adenylyltransferase [Candidatus Brocadiia bacterium]|nr:nicotinic acid mononucleotide adenylyltransferase [Gemmatimonadota bacterium]MDP6108323.1 nicotinate-nucleotide adenylyltransferase [Candidatus Brocadiia bacterium]
MERLGVMGGTFDPIHCGHLLLARSVRERLPLDRVLFVPAADPPHKDHRADIAASAHRWAMVERAIADEPGFEASPVELERNGKSYTVDSLRLLGEQNPGSELFLLIGTDNVSDMTTWHDPEGILELCTVVAGSRPTQAATRADPDLVSRIVFVETPVIDISSTHIRQRLRDGLPVRWLLPGGVEEYIRAERLYR